MKIIIGQLHIVCLSITKLIIKKTGQPVKYLPKQEKKTTKQQTKQNIYFL